ncbi:MAG: TIGR00730 family Rossman fold protein [Clostridia bacterium]|nr:TIGR00730 family Rossman fold protein [Clostridia bacterium]
MNICVYGASSDSIDKIYHDTAYSLGAAIAKNGHTLVYGGGGNGVMGAAARGASDNNGSIIGVAPTFFTVDGVLYDKCTEFVYTETMRERKQILEDRSDAFIVAPGGIGTFDEFFEILTLKQLERHNKPIAIYNVNGYYDHMLRMLELTAENNFMKPKSLELFRCFTVDTKMLDYIENYNEKPMDIRELKDIG